jgi:ribonuclease P protein component
VTSTAQRDATASSRSQLWRITDRSSFMALRRAPRARGGSLIVRHLPSEAGSAATPPRVAFAIGKPVGDAVVRNRIRRRLRAALRTLAVTGRVPAGTYLVSGDASLATIPWSDLVEALSLAIDRVSPCAPGDSVVVG